MINQEKKIRMAMKFFVFSFVLLGGILGVTSIQKVAAQETEQTTTPATAAPSNNNLGLALVGAGLAFGLASLGAGMAVGNASSAAIGAISEKPSMFGQALIFVALGEGIMIIGFAMAFILLGRI